MNTCSVNLKDIVAQMEKDLQNNQKKIGLVLGLDVNSKVTGYSVLNGQTGSFHSQQSIDATIDCFNY